MDIVFLYLEKAYDKVPRQEVWRCMREKCVPGNMKLVEEI